MGLDHLKRQPPPKPEPTATPTATATPRESKPEKKKLLVVGRWACGHDATARHLDRPCFKCQHEAIAANRVKVKEQRRVKHEARQQTNTDKPNRLPDGARFDVTYDAATLTWSGTLTVPGQEPVTASLGGVFKLLGELDRLHRESARA